MSELYFNLVKEIEIYIPYSLKFSNNNNFLIAGSNKSYELCIYDVVDFELKFVLKGHSNVIYDICFSPCDKFMTSASCDQSVIFWDFEN